MSETRIIRRSAASKTKGKTDWNRVRKLSDQDIDDAIRTDEDWTEFVDVDWSDATLVVPIGKKAISIRLDEDVIDFFEAEGRGYQTRINQVLRSYMEHRRKEADDA